MPQTSQFLVVLVTVDSLGSAESIAETLVRERLCACVNIVPSITSIYVWQGEIKSEGEILLILKTSIEKYKALEKRVLELHPYEVPEVIALPISEGSESYLRWLKQTVTS